ELAMKEGSYLVKPNIGELSVLAGRDEMDIIEIELVAKEIVSKGKCEIMVVSMGNTGAMLITKNEVYKVAAPIVKKKSTVGAGDSMVAGIVLSLSRGNSLKESLEFGVACGTAATMNMGTELCKYEDVKKLLNLIRAVPSN
ncbi:MAG: PfkB family carbohydrate kinase, partial [Ginsengibacter sp.]